MKSNFVFAAVISLFVFAFAVSAQERGANYGGTWTLDVSKSTLGERNQIESMTMSVTQTEKDITVETRTKRPPRPEGSGGGGGGRMGGGGGRMGGGGSGDAKTTYTLDGKETKMMTESPMGQIPVSLKAKTKEGKLKLSQSRTFTSQMGEMTVTTDETWELGADGKTLTVKRDQSTPQGTNSSTMVFTKS